jgi:prepilin-type N-terminal cleavage/methylation domain-containing protein
MKPDARSRRRETGRGFSLLELLLVISLVAILFTVALDRSLRYLELAEKAAMESTVGALKSALSLRLGSLYATVGRAATARLGDENPFDLLSQTPEQYAGALFDPALAEVEPGAWYYDRASRQVVYRPQRTRYLVRPRPEVDPRIRFEVLAHRFEDESRPSAAEGLVGVDIRPTTPYLWQAGSSQN